MLSLTNTCMCLYYKVLCKNAKHVEAIESEKKRHKKSLKL